MENETVFGARVLEQRTKQGWKQSELGAKVGLSHKAISTIESGKRGTSLDKLIALAYTFQVSTDYLLGITDDPVWRGTSQGSEKASF